MSKLIVEMEMPRNCDECEVNYDCAFCGITGSAFYGNTQIPNFMPDEQKLPDCPIKGVLPEEHGDLIDRDEIFSAINSRVALIDSCPEGKPSLKELFERDVLCTCLHDVVCAKAVIAAERKDDEQIH